MHFVFIVCQNRELSKYIENRHQNICFYLTSFYAVCLKKNIHLHSSLLCVIFGNMCIVIVYCPGCDVINFEINLICIIKLFFLHGQDVKTKIWISWKWKELIKWNKSHFHQFQKLFIETNKTNFWKAKTDFKNDKMAGLQI